MELDDDGAREWDLQGREWRADTRDLVAILSVAMWRDIKGERRNDGESYIDWVDGYSQSKRYRP